MHAGLGVCYFLTNISFIISFKASSKNHKPDVLSHLFGEEKDKKYPNPTMTTMFYWGSFVGYRGSCIGSNPYN